MFGFWSCVASGSHRASSRAFYEKPFERPFARISYSGLRLLSDSRNTLRSLKEDNIEGMANPLRKPAAVVTAKRLVDNPWTSEIWVPVAVIERDGAREDAPILLERNEAGEQWLHLGFEVELNRTEADGYYLNLTTDHPVAFVEWELTEMGAEPRWVTLSYHEAARRMDGGAQVEAVPIPERVAAVACGVHAAASEDAGEKAPPGAGIVPRRQA